MAFGKISKQDLIDAGLDPDKLREFQEKGVTKDDLAALQTANTETKTAIDEIKTTLATLATKLGGNTGGDNSGGNNDNKGGNGSNNDDKPDEMTEYVANPVDFINKKTNTVVAAAAIEFKRMSRDMAYERASSSLPGFKNSALKAEIDEEWKKYTPEVFARNNGDPAILIKQIHDMILGKHHDEIVQDANKKDGKYNLVHSGASSGGGGGNTGITTSSTGSDKKVLTDEEKVLAKKFGMKEEDWLKQGEDMEAEEISRRRLPVGA